MQFAITPEKIKSLSQQDIKKLRDVINKIISEKKSWLKSISQQLLKRISDILGADVILEESLNESNQSKIKKNSQINTSKERRGSKRSNSLQPEPEIANIKAKEPVFQKMDLKIKLPPKPEAQSAWNFSEQKAKSALDNHQKQERNPPDAFSPFWSSWEKADEVRNSIMDLYDNPKPTSPPAYLNPPLKIPQFDQTSTSSISDKLRLLKSSSKFSTDDTSEFAENSLRSQPSFNSIRYNSPAQTSEQNDEADMMSTKEKLKFVWAAEQRQKSNLLIGPNLKNNLFSSKKSDTSERSAGLGSLAGSHNFNSPSTNLGSVFGSTSGSGSNFSNYKNNSEEKRSKFRSSISSGISSDVKYLGKEDLTPLNNPSSELAGAQVELGNKEEWSVQFDACNVIRWVI